MERSNIFSLHQLFVTCYIFLDDFFMTVYFIPLFTSNIWYGASHSAGIYGMGHPTVQAFNTWYGASHSAGI